MASATFTIRIAPDLAELLDYFSLTAHRFCEAGATDRRVMDFMAEVGSASVSGVPLVDVIFDAGHVMVTCDELLRLVAKMRAVERAVFA